MSERLIETGDRYSIKWKTTGQYHYGDIIEIRPLKKRQRTDSSMDESISRQNDEFEYYVHYLNFDRRLDEWVTADRIDLSTLTASTADGYENMKSRKYQKRKNEDGGDGTEKTDEPEDKEAILNSLEKENEEITKVKNIQCIVLGRYEIDTWYFSPYPDEYSGEDKLYLCEYCLKYMKKQKTLINHSLKCEMKSPPGKLIYLDPATRLTMFEIDGKEHKLYCQNLCLLSKLFLDHKTLYYDVDPFLFYVLCEQDQHSNHHIVGYFSKEKQSQENYNLACILTFPPYQRKGYGKFLISVSYELSKREGTVGSPEKPLSDLGRISYRSYWAYIILQLFHEEYKSDTIKMISIEKISRLTGIRIEDILSTLHSLNMIKYWKGQHVISVQKPVITAFLQESKKLNLCNPECLTWIPPEKPNKLTKGAGSIVGGSMGGGTGGGMGYATHSSSSSSSMAHMQ